MREATAAIAIAGVIATILVMPTSATAVRSGVTHAAVGEITEFAVPTTGSGPAGIAPGPDGNVWFTERNVSKIGLVTPQGDVFDR
jgi:virginiamycin B lyase